MKRRVDYEMTSRQYIDILLILSCRIPLKTKRQHADEESNNNKEHKLENCWTIYIVKIVDLKLDI